MMPCPICDEKPINCQCTQAELRMHYEIEELEEKVPRWIPVSERLPEMGKKVMVAHAVDGWVSVGQRDKTGSYEYWSDDGEEIYEPTHWMPLPEPPEVG